MDSDEPLRPQIFSGLDVVDVATEMSTGVYQLPGVIAVSAAHDDHRVGLLSELNRGVVPLFGWLANAVNEPHFGLGETPAHKRDQMPDAVNWLSCLRCNTEPSTLCQFVNVRFAQDHVEFR